MDLAITGWKRYALVQPPMMVLIFAQAISSNYKIFCLKYTVHIIIAYQQFKFTYINII